MKWFFWRRKDSPKEVQDDMCEHPVSHQVILREDPAAPTKVTGMKCTQCGMVFVGDSSQMGSKGKAA